MPLLVRGTSALRFTYISNTSFRGGYKDSESCLNAILIHYYNIQLKNIVSPETAAGVVQECRRRRYGTVIVPFPAAELTEALAQPLHRSGIALWVHEKCAHTAPGARVLVCTALSGGDIENRLSACCRAFGPDRIVLDLQRLRMDFPLPCPTGEGIPLTDEQLAALQTGRQIFFSRELGARYFTYRRGGETRFVLLDDGDTLHRKIALGERLGIHRGLLTLPECADILRDLTG